jgi:GntR family transcriptional regulator, transcriptional repressor for pyruvate dehydrogenase complex
VAERILQLIGELALRPGDRMPTENELSKAKTAIRCGTRK